MNLFGTDGIRGRANEFPLVPAYLTSIGRAIGVFFKGNGMVILGGDPRLSTTMISTALVSGITSTGRSVLLADVIPTPVLAHLVRQYKAPCGVMVSASHNPWHDNGVKIFNNSGYKLSLAEEDNFSKQVESKESSGPSSVGSVYYIVAWQEQYIARLKSQFKLNLSKLKIVLDLANGATCTLAPMIFEAFGAKPITISNEPDGVNINEGCGAGDIKKLRAAVLKNKADIGIAFDGDGDRIIMVDENGNKVDGDAIMALLAINWWQRRKLRGAKIIATQYSNLALSKILTEKGIKIEFVDTGDRFVAERMRQARLNLGGEKSGHIVLSDYETTGNGIVTALATLEALGKRRLSEANTVKDFPQVLINVDVKEKPPLEKLPQVMDAMKAAENKLGTLGRVFVRYSGTQPMARVMIEGESEKLIKPLAENIANAIRKGLC